MLTAVIMISDGFKFDADEGGGGELGLRARRRNERRGGERRGKRRRA